MAVKQKKTAPKRKPVEGHKVVMINVPDEIVEKLDTYYREDGYTTRSEWLRNQLRLICAAREDEE